MVKSYIPKSYKRALELLAEKDLIILAGGTDLMVKKRNWSGLAPGFEKDVLFVSHIKSLKFIKREKNKIHIGAGVTLETLLRDDKTPELLKKAIELMASPGIRHTATLAGNIGNASPAGDTLPVLYILNAKVVLENREREIVVDIKDLITGPGSKDMGKDEIIREIVIADESFDYIMYEKVGGRKSDAISKVSFAGAVKSTFGMITDIRFAFGAVAPTIVRDMEFEKRFRETPVGDLIKTADYIKEHYEPKIRPINDQRSTAEYRKACALNILGKFLTEVKKSYK